MAKKTSDKGSKEGPVNQLTTTLGGEGGGGGDDGPRLPVMSMEQSSEIQAAILLAKKFPREEAQAQKELLAICDLEIFAGSAFYAFPRGRKLDEATGQWKQNIVSGPSIRMAREMARIYGNFRYGFVITHEDDDGRQIVAYAWDVQSNNRTTSSDYFKKLIQRRVGTGENATTIPVTPDERELRELTNRRASILMRNCILSLLPSYFVDNAVLICQKTVGGGGKGIDDLADRVQKMLTSFAELGISQIQVETYLKKPALQATRDDLGELRGIYESLRDGIISPQEKAELFGGSGSREAAKGPGIDTPKLSEADMRPAGDQHQVHPSLKKPDSAEPFPLKEGAQAPPAQETGKETELAQPPLPEAVTPDQRKDLMAGLRKSRKTLKDLQNYAFKAGFDIDKPVTPDQYQDALGFASFIPPTEPSPDKKEPPKAETKPADKSNGEPALDPKVTALKIIGEMNQENFSELKKQVIGLCNQIKGTANIVAVTIELGKRQKEFDVGK